MMLSVMEQVVRKGLKEENAAVVATGNKINRQPTQVMILRIFSNILYQQYAIHDGKVRRRLLKPLNDSQAKIIRYLGIPESAFAWNSLTRDADNYQNKTYILGSFPKYAL